MIETKELTDELRALVRRLEDDIKTHSEETEGLGDWLRSEFARAKEAGRTGQAFESWREEQVTLSAVGWALTCVFVRFCEDNGLIAEPRLSGPGDRLEAAADTARHFFQQHPGYSDREYLLWVFDQAAGLPGMKALMEAKESRMRELPISVDGATELLEFWRQADSDTGELTFDFSDPERNTRFLGDLYQDLSESARKRYALRQTPVFIEEFILDRTLDPAIEDFGLPDASVIDPACGSGHFLLGSFDRLLARWREREPETNIRVLCQRAFDQIAGVDLNPFAIAIAHFRLLVAALNACDISELREAPDFRVEVATGDALLHGHPPGQLPDASGTWARPAHQHFYEVEDSDQVTNILDQRYAAVVANPPYITPKDAALRNAYRDRYQSCRGQYALSVPFMERLFDLAKPAVDGRLAGYVGQITSNSFMKREFGRRLVEDYLAVRVDLTNIVDMSGIDIPGHGTPTVMLFGRNRLPRLATVHGLLGIRGEPSPPANAVDGKVWSEIRSMIDCADGEGTYVSMEEIPRSRLAEHPWSLQGGGAAKVRDALESVCDVQLADVTESIGFASFPGQDEAFVMDPATASRLGLSSEFVREFIEGEIVRDWASAPRSVAIVPYDSHGSAVKPSREILRRLWPMRTTIWSTISFGGKTRKENQEPWWTWYRWVASKYQSSLSITFADMVTHNHFALDRGAGAFKQSAPVIKLPDGVSETAHVGLTGLLNSSVGCFWMQQVFHNKGGPGGGSSKDEKWHDFFQFDSTKLARFPLPRGDCEDCAALLDRTARELVRARPGHARGGSAPVQMGDDALKACEELKGRLVSVQEELDWKCYGLYGLLDGEFNVPLEQVPDIVPGERAFEIVLARRVAAGQLETRWFERQESLPITDIPSRWSEPYRSVVERRVEAIEAVDGVKLIEQPEYKRRWTTLKPSSWNAMEIHALRSWLLDQLEAQSVWPDSQLQSASEIGDRILAHHELQAALERYGGEDSQPGKVIVKLLADEAVPYLASLCYKESGLDKRAVWERTWDLQRAEDRGECVGSIDVPPKYKQADFRSPTFWKHRGKLDVPKERFTSYPDVGADGSTLYGWAGWDHAQRAQGLAQRIVEAQEGEGMEAERILPLVAGLLELLPWLHQWHAEPDPAYGMPLSDFYETFLDERVRAVDATREDLLAWRPPEKKRKGRKATA